MTRSLAWNDRKRDVGAPSPTTVHRTHPQEAMPTHRPAGQMRILQRDTWVPPYRVRRSCRTGRRGRRPLQRFIAPVRRGRCPHIAPPDKCAFCGGTHGSRPTGQAGHAGRDVGAPSPTTAHRTHPQGDDAHTLPRRTNAHFAAGHMGPALQGTPVMQDGTSGRRPLQRLTVPIRRGRCPHRPADICDRTGSLTG